MIMYLTVKHPDEEYPAEYVAINFTCPADWSGGMLMTRAQAVANDHADHRVYWRPSRVWTSLPDGKHVSTWIEPVPMDGVEVVHARGDGWQVSAVDECGVPVAEKRVGGPAGGPSEVE